MLGARKQRRAEVGCNSIVIEWSGWEAERVTERVESTHPNKRRRGGLAGRKTEIKKRKYLHKNVSIEQNLAARNNLLVNLCTMEALVPRHTHNTHTGVTKEDQASAERNSGGCECKANSNRWNDFSKKAFYVGSFLAEEGGGLKFCPGSGRNKKTIISSNFEEKLWTCNNQKGEEFFF